MSLFDFFKKKNKPTDSEQAEDTQAKMDASIELVATEQGSHGDNWGGLIGFGFLQSTEGQLINEYMTLSSMMEPVLSKGNVDIHQAIFEKEMGNKDVGIRTLKSGKSLLSAYPYLRTSYTVPFEIKQIIEWAHMGNLEAEIKGGGRDTFGFGFFATDYAVNSDLYKSTPRLNIKVSAIGFVLDKSDLTEIDGKKV
ncbi:MAG: hypothetical protein AB8F95_16090, partial [Bacteroidia bacterium]